jgi:hypothetical protein
MGVLIIYDLIYICIVLTLPNWITSPIMLNVSKIIKFETVFY